MSKRSPDLAAGIRDSHRQNFTIWRNMRREFRILGYPDFSFCGLVGRTFLNPPAI
jgi:hypothetical protein